MALLRNSRSIRTRTALVGAVRSELEQSGQFTAPEVARRAGCSEATFYTHFATKDDALAEAFAATLDELLDLIGRQLDPGRLETESVDVVLAGLVDGLVRYFRRGQLLWRAALARLRESDAIRQVYRRADREGLSTVRQFIEAGQRGGQIRAGDAGALAAATVVIAQGLNNPHALRPGSGEAGRFVAEALAAMLRAPDAGKSP